MSRRRAGYVQVTHGRPRPGWRSGHVRSKPRLTAAAAALMLLLAWSPLPMWVAIPVLVAFVMLAPL